MSDLPNVSGISRRSISSPMEISSESESESESDNQNENQSGSEEETNIISLNNSQIRAIILYNYMLKITAKECLENMKKAFGENSINLSPSINILKGLKKVISN